MQSPDILLIDDDRRLADMVGRYLGQAGFSVQVRGTVREGMPALESRVPGLILLDLMLPDGDGLDVCRRIRQQPGPVAQVPILMLTARGETTDRVVGLEVGADDYLPKPFEPRELLARVRALLRRSAVTATVAAPPVASGAAPQAGFVASGAASGTGPHATSGAAPATMPGAFAGTVSGAAPGAMPGAFPGAASGAQTAAFSGMPAATTIVIDDLEIDEGAREVRVGGERRTLTGYQFDLLLVLARHAGRVMSREQLMDQAKGQALEAFDRSIDVHVGKIRQAIEQDPRQPVRLLTVRGVGYVLSKPRQGG